MLPKIVLNFHCLNIINCSSDLKNFANSRPSASNFKSFSRSLEQFFVTVGQNNFGSKIPLILTVSTNGLQVIQMIWMQKFAETSQKIFLCIPFEVKKCKSWYVVWCSLMYTFLGLGGYSRFLSIQHDFWHQKYAFNFSFYFVVWQFKSSPGRI